MHRGKVIIRRAATSHNSSVGIGSYLVGQAYPKERTRGQRNTNGAIALECQRDAKQHAQKQTEKEQSVDAHYHGENRNIADNVVGDAATNIWLDGHTVS